MALTGSCNSQTASLTSSVGGAGCVIGLELHRQYKLGLPEKE